MQITRIAFVLAAALGIVACNGRYRSALGTDGGSTADSSMQTDAGPVFSDNCPSSPVFDQQTCISSTNGAVCAGHTYCDSCARDVATTCTCVPYTLGFQFVCEDPCTTCGVDAGAPSDDAGTHDAATADAGGPFTANGACQFTTGDGNTICEQYSSEWTASDAEIDCASTDGASYIGVCPTSDRIGACVLPSGYFWFYAPTAVETARSPCVDGGGLWVDP